MNTEISNTASLQAVIADAYRTFRDHKAPRRPLDACTMCCMPQELEQEMRQLPLAKLTERHFYEYNTAAMSQVQPADEVLYLLPRMLELMAHGADVHHTLELSWDRVGRCPAGTFSKAEADLLNRFALAYFQATLRGDWRRTSHRRWLEDPLSVLLMFHIGGLAIQPLLDLWVETTGPESTVQYVRSSYRQFWESQDYANPFASDRPVFKHQLRLWLLDAKQRQRFAERLVSPAFQRMAELQPPVGRITFSTMVDAVFDQLTQ